MVEPPTGLMALAYVSTARIPRYSHDMLAICRSSLRRNAVLKVSGVLYFDGLRFFQVLEGDAVNIRHVFGLIQKDRRHSAVHRLYERPVAERRFGAEPMRFVDGARLPDLAASFPEGAIRRGDEAARRDTEARIGTA